MSLSRIKNWVAEVLTYSDLNAEFNNILNNTNSLISPFTADVSAGSFKLTALAAGTARTDAASLATIQDGTGIYSSTVGGTADAITLTPSPAITAYAAGQAFYWIASGANTTAVTLAVSGLASPKAVTKNGTTALVAGDIPSGALVGARYDGTRFQLVTIGAATIPTGVALLSTYTTAGDIVQATGSAAVARLGIGTAGGILQVNSGATALAYLALGTARQVPFVNAGATALAYANPITLSAEYTTTGGTSIPFTGIPAGVRRITIMIKQLSANSTSNWQVQVGDAGGLETSGYLSSCFNGATTDFTAGFGINKAVVAAVTYQGKVVLDLESAANFTWVATSILTGATEAIEIGAGQKSLSQELDRLSIVPANGSDTFDVVAVSISYE